jgi:hypothetical protein
LGRGKKEGIHPDFGENWGEWGNKKATASADGLAVELYLVGV